MICPLLSFMLPLSVIFESGAVYHWDWITELGGLVPYQVYICFLGDVKKIF